MIHNINVYRSSGDPARVRLFTFAADDVCNLPDGSQILHSKTFYDDSGDYLELWVSVPEGSELLRVAREVQAASDEPDTLHRDENPEQHDYDEPNDDDEALFKA